MIDKKETKETKEKVKVVPRIVRLVSGEQLIAGIAASTAPDFVQLVDPYKIDIFVMEPVETNFWSEEKMSLKPWCFQSTDTVVAIKKVNILALAHPTKSMTEYYDNVKTGKFPFVRTGKGAMLKKEEENTIKEPKIPDIEFDRILETMDDEEYGDIYDYLRGRRTIH